MMSGLVGEMHTLVLPSISPILTVLLTLLTWMVSSTYVYTQRNKNIFYISQP